MPHPSVREHLAAHGISLEFSDTKSAARTFDVLVQEGRSLMGILFPLVPTRASTAAPTPSTSTPS